MTWAAALIAAAATPAAVGAARSRAILGHWRGTSICVKADWNAACHDERVVYEFVPAGSDSARTLLHASKHVAGRFEPMGDLEFRYSPASDTWDANFANARVRVRWTFRLRGDTLVGEARDLPGRRVARHVIAWREPAKP